MGTLKQNEATLETIGNRSARYVTHIDSLMMAVQ